MISLRAEGPVSGFAMTLELQDGGVKFKVEMIDFSDY
jgi:hypothetical protein